MRTRKPIQALSYVEELKQIFYKHGKEAMCDRLSEIAKSHIKEVDKILKWFKEIPQTSASGSYAEKYLAEFEVERKRLAYIDYLACQHVPSDQIVDIAAGTMSNFFPWIKAFKPQVVSGSMGGIKSLVGFYFPAYASIVFESPGYVKMESALRFSNQQFLFIGFNPSDSVNFKANKDGLLFSKAFPTNTAFFAHDFVSLIHVLRANDIEGAEYIVLKVGEDGSIHPDTAGYVSTDPEYWFEKLNGPGTLASVMHWFDRTNPVEPAYAKIEGMIMEAPEDWNEKAQKCIEFLKSQSSWKLEDALKSFGIEPNAENMQRFIAYLTEHDVVLKTHLSIETHFKVSIIPKAPKWIKQKGIDSLKNMVSKDALNPGATGVFFEGRRMVATDKRKIVIVPTSQKEFKGKIIDIKTKSVIDAQFPDYKSLLKYDFQMHSLPIPIDEFAAKVNGAKKALESVETAMKAIDFVIGYTHFTIHPALLLDTLLALKANGASKIVVSVSIPQNKAVLMSRLVRPEEKAVVLMRLDGDNGTIGLIAALLFTESGYDPWDLIKTEPFKISLPEEPIHSETKPAFFLPEIEFGSEKSELSTALESLRTALEFSDDQASIQEAIAALETAMEFA